MPLATAVVKREIVVAAVSLVTIVAVGAGLWVALLDQNAHFGVSPDAVLDLEFGNESAIPDDASLSFVDDIGLSGDWVASGNDGEYRSSRVACTITFREALVDPDDVSAGDDRATSIAFIFHVTGRQISSDSVADSPVDFVDNGIERDAGASTVAVDWQEPDGSLYVVQARANGSRGVGVFVTGRCDPGNDVVIARFQLSAVTVMLEHDARPPRLFIPYKG